MTTPTPAAWYPDPSTPGQLRWWDGTQWTENVAPAQPAAPQAAGVQQGYGTAAPGYGAPQPGFGQPLTPEQGMAGHVYAEFWQRLVALIIDSIILSIPAFIVYAIVGASGGGFGYGVGGSFAVSYLLASMLVIAVGAAYFIYLIGTQGQTVGMRVLNIKVIDATGAIIGLETSGRRWLIPGGLQALGILPILGVLAGIAGLINYLSMLWDDQNRCWHDKFAGTWVVKTN